MVQHNVEDAGYTPHHKLFIYHTKHSFLIVGQQTFPHNGGPRQRKQYSLLRIVRQDGPQLQASEDPTSYTLAELNALLHSTHAACSQQGGLQFVTKAYGLVGCIRFTASFYLLIITRRSFVGSVCGHKVYSVSSVSLLPLGAAVGVSQQKDSLIEKRYRKVLMGVDLSKNFYFCLTYRLASTLQANHQAGMFRQQQDEGLADGDLGNSPFSSAAFSNDEFENMFVWNSYLTRSLRQVLGNCLWLVALIHGYWDQRRLSVLGRPMTVTLLARRSRHFAGTRFKKRGLSDQGKVANEVEVEQILDVGLDHGSGLPLVSSIVQVRGSVPLYWSQQPTPLSPKPDILMQSFDPMYEATARHFDDLRVRYGSPTVCLNLLKSKERRPRETLLRREMGIAIAMLNKRSADGDQLVHVPWDFQKHAKIAGAGLLSEISSITHLTLEATGLFVHNPSTVQMAPGLPVPSPASLLGPKLLSLNQAQDPGASLPTCEETTAGTDMRASEVPLPLRQAALRKEAKKQYRSRLYQHNAAPDSDVIVPPWYCLYQQGILRTNCIDCLDRTNVAQFAYGLVAFGLQLYLLGVGESPEIDSDSSMALVLMEQYELMGNTLSMQYGGSDAHSMFFQRKKGQWEAGSRSKDLLTSIQRFYSNTYTDAEKQDAINLVLGNYIPGKPGQPELWELEHDVYLHNATDASVASAWETHSWGPSAQPSAGSMAGLPPPPPRVHTHAPSRSGSYALPPSPHDLQPRRHPSNANSNPSPSGSYSANPRSNPNPSPSNSYSGRLNSLSRLSPSPLSQYGTSPAVFVDGRSTPHASREESYAPGDATASRSVAGTHRPASVMSEMAMAYHNVMQTNLSRRMASSVSLISLSSDDDGAAVEGSQQPAGGNDFEGLLASLGAQADTPRGDVGAVESSWSGFGGIWSTLFGAAPRPPPGVPMPKEVLDSLQSFDIVLSRSCRRSLPVRLHTLLRGAQDQPLVMWQAVQQAFSYFWTQQDLEDAPTDQPPPTPKTPLLHLRQQQQQLEAAPHPTGATDAWAPRRPLSSFDSDMPGSKGGSSKGIKHQVVYNNPLPTYMCLALLSQQPAGGGVLRPLPSKQSSCAATKPPSQFLLAVKQVRDMCPVSGVSRPAGSSGSISRKGSVSGRMSASGGSAAAAVVPSVACVWSLSDSRRSAMTALMRLGQKHGHSSLATVGSQAVQSTQRMSTDSATSQGQAAVKRRPSLPTIGETSSSAPNLMPPGQPTLSKIPPISTAANGRPLARTAGCLPALLEPESDVLRHHTFTPASSMGWAAQLGVAGGTTHWMWHLDRLELPVEQLLPCIKAAHQHQLLEEAAQQARYAAMVPHQLAPPATSPPPPSARRDRNSVSNTGTLGMDRPVLGVMSMFSFRASSTNGTAAAMASPPQTTSGGLWARRASQLQPAVQPPVQPQPPGVHLSTTEEALGIVTHVPAVPPVVVMPGGGHPGFLAAHAPATEQQSQSFAWRHSPVRAGMPASSTNTPPITPRRLSGTGRPPLPTAPHGMQSQGRPNLQAHTPPGTPPRPPTASQPSHTANSPAPAYHQPHSSMAALGRAPVGMGPHTASGSAVQTSGRPAGSASSYSQMPGLWELVNASNIVTAISHIAAGGSSKDSLKPPIPLLNDFISIGPQAEATLAARRLASNPGAASASGPLQAKSSYLHNQQPRPLYQHVDDYVLVEAYYEGMDEGRTRPAWEQELDETTGLHWCSELGGWLPAPASMARIMNQSIHGLALTSSSRAAWNANAMHEMPSMFGADVLASLNEPVLSSPGNKDLPEWATWATCRMPGGTSTCVA